MRNTALSSTLSFYYEAKTFWTPCMTFVLLDLKVSGDSEYQAGRFFKRFSYKQQSTCDSSSRRSKTVGVAKLATPTGNASYTPLCPWYLAYYATCLLSLNCAFCTSLNYKNNFILRFFSRVPHTLRSVRGVFLFNIPTVARNNTMYHEIRAIINSKVNSQKNGKG